MRSLLWAALCGALLVSNVCLGADSEQTYEVAYKHAQEDGRPIMVLVGADWCPGCQRMKQGTIANLLRRGRLRRVHYASVNTDRNSRLAKKLMHGESIPQLIVYSKTPTGWHREQVTGAQSEEQVEALIERAVERQAKATESETDSIQR